MMTSKNFRIEANILDPVNKRSGYGVIVVKDGLIDQVTFHEPVQEGKPYLLPGFIDAHIHIESSMLTPPAFAQIAVSHGTVGTVSDPHEIANVCGIEGVRYMVDLGKKSGFHFFFGAPSCVPATSFETAGATLSVEEIIQLFEEKSTYYLSEMMNYPAVLDRDPLVMDKIAAAQRYGLPVDGHAPGLMGADAQSYAAAGITSDHECTTLPEALDKIKAGMTIIIREGSAAKNYNALHSLISIHPEKVMFCSDDKHPDDLLLGHINELVIRSLSHGYDILDILNIACVNPVKHYSLPIGLLQEGDPADMILVENTKSFHVLSTWIKGQQVFDGLHVNLPAVPLKIINSFSIMPIDPHDIQLPLRKGSAKVIVAIDGSIVTESTTCMVTEGYFESDSETDILKIVVVNRYSKSPPALALIKGFGLKQGAIASSVAHDSHNIIAVGTNDHDLTNCINAIIDHKGGVTAAANEVRHILPLPIAGLMSPLPANDVGQAYEKIDHFVKHELGSTLQSPFMTLSFMALLVIPSLKLSDKGLFDGHLFQMTSVQ